MKKQSVYFLLFAFIGLIVMVILFFDLQERKRSETAAKEALAEAQKELARQYVLLEIQEKSATETKNELDSWRMSLLEVDSIPAAVMPEVIVLPEEVATAVAPEPAIGRPTIFIENNSRLINSRVREVIEDLHRNVEVEMQTSGVPTELDQAQNPTTAAVQVPFEPMIYRTKTQHYGLREESVSKSICFGYIIYIQDAKTREASIELQKMLKEKGAIVPAIQSKNLPRNFATSIKYFHKEDERAAQWVKEVLPNILKKQGADAIPVTYIANAKVSLGQLEVWIGN